MVFTDFERKQMQNLADQDAPPEVFMDWLKHHRWTQKQETPSQKVSPQPSIDFSSNKTKNILGNFKTRVLPKGWDNNILWLKWWSLTFRTNNPLAITATWSNSAERLIKKFWALPEVLSPDSADNLVLNFRTVEDWLKAWRQLLDSKQEMTISQLMESHTWNSATWHKAQAKKLWINLNTQYKDLSDEEKNTVIKAIQIWEWFTEGVKEETQSMTKDAVNIWASLMSLWQSKPKEDLNILQKVTSLWSRPFVPDEKTWIAPIDKKEDFTDLSQAWPDRAVRVIGKWAVSFLKHTVQSAKSVVDGLFWLTDKAIVKPTASTIREAIWKQPLTDEQRKNIWSPDTNIQEDLLNLGQGSMMLWLTSVFPVATVNFNIAWATEEWDKVLQTIWTAIQKWGNFMNKIPWLSDYRKSLPEHRRADFDAFIGQWVMLWTFKVTSKLNEVKNGWLKADRTAQEAAWNILRPTKSEIKFLDAWTRGLLATIKEEWWVIIKVKTVEELGNKVNKNKKETWKPYKEGLEKGQETLNKIEINNPLKWKTQDSSLTSALDQLVDVFDWVSSKTLRNTKDRVSELKNKHDTQGLTLKEIQEVKQLHTENNRLFTEKGEIKGKTISKDDLRWIRSDIKTLLENRATTGWVKNIAELNKAYSDLIATESLLRNRQAEIKTGVTKTVPSWIIEWIITKILDLPGIDAIAWWVLRWLLNSAKRQTAWSGRINVLEMEAMLPKLLKEIRTKTWNPSLKQNIFSIIIDNGFVIVWDSVLYIWESTLDTEEKEEKPKVIRDISKFKFKKWWVWSDALKRILNK